MTITEPTMMILNEPILMGLAALVLATAKLVWALRRKA